MKLNIAKLPGDGVGPEVVEQAVKAIDAVCRRFGHEVKYRSALVGACAIDACGSAFPEETLKVCLDSDAVLFGAVGDPKYDNDPTAKVRPEQGLLAMRRELGLYANIRPVETFPSLLESFTAQAGDRLRRGFRLRQGTYRRYVFRRERPFGRRRHSVRHQHLPPL